MGKIVQAIVRGPENYFDGELHPPGDIVEVDEDFVSEDEFVERDVTVPLKNEIVVDGKIVRSAIETIKVRTRFMPLGSAATANRPATTAEIATGGIDRLNVTDFLKGGSDEIVASIVDGNVDDHLGAIEQGEISRKGGGRKDVTNAIAMRNAALRG